MFIDPQGAQLTECNANRLHLHGMMKADTLDICGLISAVPHLQDKPWLVSFFLDPALLRSFLDRFSNVDLKLELINLVEGEKPTSIDWLNPITHLSLEGRAPGPSLQITQIISKEITNE